MEASQVYECRLFGEALKEDVIHIQEVLDCFSVEPYCVLQFEEVVFATGEVPKNDRQFRKTIRLRKPIPLLAYQMDIEKTHAEQGLSEWSLRVEAAPLRGLEWSSSYPCFVQSVIESDCTASEASMVHMCRKNFGLKEIFRFVNQCSRLKRNRSSNWISDSHCLIELTVRSDQAEMKAAASALNALYVLLKPWMRSSMS